MATSKTKTGATLVSTTRGGTFYKFNSKFMLGANGTTAYFAVKAEIVYILNRLFRFKSSDETTAVVYYGTNGGRSTFVVKTNSLGGFSIGCQAFDRKTVRTIAKEVGWSSSYIRAYLPVTLAKAAAAGR